MELRDIALIYDCPHSTAPDEGEGYALIRTPNIGKGRLLMDNVHRVRKEVYDKRNKRAIPQEGDIIFAREAPAGNAALITKGQKVCLGQRTVLIKPNHSICDSEFLVYYILSPKQQVKLLGFSHGATVQHVNIAELSKLPLNLPPLSIQHRIASILSVYDNLIENNNRRIRILEQMAENLYKEWFVRFRFPGHEKAEFENGLPKGWKVDKYLNVAKISAGGDRPNVFSQILTEDCAIPIYSNGIVDDGLYGYTNQPKIKKPCITISARGTVGFVCMRRTPFVPIVRLLSVVPNDNLNVYYLYHSSIYNDLEGNGTSQQQLTVPMLNKRKILIPSIEILELFRKSVEPLYDQIDIIKEQSSLLSRQRDLLLPRLMSGKLEVKV